MSDTNPYLEKFAAKYDQLKAKLTELKADAKIKADLDKREVEVKKAMEDLKTSAADNLSAANEKVKSTLDSWERKINEILS